MNNSNRAIIEQIKNDALESLNCDNELVFTIDGFDFYEDDFSFLHLRYIAVEMYLWKEGKVNETTQRNNILKLILDQTSGLSH